MFSKINWSPGPAGLEFNRSFAKTLGQGPKNNTAAESGLCFLCLNFNFLILQMQRSASQDM